MLINAATPLNGTAVLAGETYPLPLAYPSPYATYIDGFGGVALDRVLRLTNSSTFSLFVLDDTASLSSRETASFCYSLPQNASGGDVKLTLYENDKTISSKALVLTFSLSLFKLSFPQSLDRCTGISTGRPPACERS